MIRSLFQRSITLFMGLAAGKVLSTIIFILLARTLLPESFGQILFLATFLQIVTVLADFGLVQWYQAHYEKEKDHFLFHRILRARLLTLIVSAVAAFTFLTLTRTFPLPVIVLLIFTLLPDSLLSIGDAYYLPRQKTKAISYKNPSRMLIILVGYLLTQKFFNLEIAACLFLFSSLITAIWFFPWKVLKDWFSFNLMESYETLKSSATFAFLIVTSFLYARSDSFVIQYSLGSGALGIYGAAYRYLESLSLLPTALAQNLFPLAARKGFITATQLQKIFAIMAVLGLVLATGLYFSAELLTTTLLGVNYSAASPLVRVFSFVVLLFFINSPLSMVVQSSSLVKKFLPFGMINTLLNIGGNLFLIPQYGIIAAAWMMVVTELTGFLINCLFVLKVYSPKNT
ncbi:MAG: oligosaccharide flippase family protein [bacterium]|nr:oligosaccharide flippase family protein [bacterium]